MIRSVLAVIAGYIAMVILTMALFILMARIAPGVLPREGMFPAPPVVALILGFAFLSALVGGFVTATVALRSEEKHVFGLAAVVLVMGALNATTAGNSQPLWYLSALVLLALAGVYVGGNIYMNRNRPE